MSGKVHHSASCACGKVMVEAAGAPIVSATCYCQSCRSASRQFEHAPGAPKVLTQDGGTDYCLYRKDRVRIARGGAHLQERRLTAASPTRRVVATCCNAPMFLDFTRGHWLSLYRDRLPRDIRPPTLRVMVGDLPAGSALAEGLPAYQRFPATFMIKLLRAWAAMGFRRPKVTW